MKTLFIFTASTFFIIGAASARWDGEVPAIVKHKASATAAPVAQFTSLDRDSGAQCTTTYIAKTNGDGKTTIRQSVNCEE